MPFLSICYKHIGWMKSGCKLSRNWGHSSWLIVNIPNSGKGHADWIMRWHYSVRTGTRLSLINPFHVVQHGFSYQSTVAKDFRETQIQECQQGNRSLDLTHFTVKYTLDMLRLRNEKSNVVLRTSWNIPLPRLLSSPQEPRRPYLLR